MPHHAPCPRHAPTPCPHAPHAPHAVQPTESFGLTRHANFRGWLTAMLLLLRMSSGEAWNSVMHDCAIQPAAARALGDHVLYGGWEDKAECDDDPDTCGLSCCGSEGLAVAYFLSFQVFCAFVLLNLVIAVILENFSSTAAESQSIITPADTAQFQREWLRLDPAGTYFIPSVHLPAAPPHPPPHSPPHAHRMRTACAPHAHRMSTACAPHAHRM